MRLLPDSRQRRGRVNALAGSSTTGVAGSTPWPAARPRPRTGCPGERGPTLERATSGATENAASPTAAPAGKRAARHERVSRAVIAPRESRGERRLASQLAARRGEGAGKGRPATPALPSSRREEAGRRVGASRRRRRKGEREGSISSPPRRRRRAGGLAATSPRGRRPLPRPRRRRHSADRPPTRVPRLASPLHLSRPRPRATSPRGRARLPGRRRPSAGPPRRPRPPRTPRRRVGHCRVRGDDDPSPAVPRPSSAGRPSPNSRPQTRVPLPPLSAAAARNVTVRRPRGRARSPGRRRPSAGPPRRPRPPWTPLRRQTAPLPPRGLVHGTRLPCRRPVTATSAPASPAWPRAFASAPARREGRKERRRATHTPSRRGGAGGSAAFPSPRHRLAGGRPGERGQPRAERRQRRRGGGWNFLLILFCVESCVNFAICLLRKIGDVLV